MSRSSDVLLKGEPGLTLDLFVSSLSEVIGCSRWEMRESSWYVEKRYFVTSVLGFKITVSIADDSRFDDFHFRIVFSPERDCRSRESFSADLADCVARKFARRGYEAVRHDVMGRLDSGGTRYLPDNDKRSDAAVSTARFSAREIPALCIEVYAIPERKRNVVIDRKTIGSAAYWMFGIASLSVIILTLTPLRTVFGLGRAVDQRQRMILYQIDYSSLGALLRNFAMRQRWSVAQTSNGDSFFPADDPSIPPELRLLKPSSIRLNDQKIDLEFGGALLHFGVSAYRPGLRGAGVKELGEGLWFYSENGRSPSPM